MKERRHITKWVVGLAYAMQLDRQHQFVTKALQDPDEQEVDLNLENISMEFAKEVKLNVYEWFKGLPDELLKQHQVAKNQSDFERLYYFPLEKFILLEDDKLRHYTW